MKKGPFKMKLKSPIMFKGANSKNSKCWPGKKKVGTKPSPSRPGVTVNDCRQLWDLSQVQARDQKLLVVK